jgi:hypothetical protein
MIGDGLEFRSSFFPCHLSDHQPPRWLTPGQPSAIFLGPLFSSVAQWQSIRLLTGGL